MAFDWSPRGVPLGGLTRRIEVRCNFLEGPAIEAEHEHLSDDLRFGGVRAESATGHLVAQGRMEPEDAGTDLHLLRHRHVHPLAHLLELELRHPLYDVHHEPTHRVRRVEWLPAR